MALSLRRVFGSVVVGALAIVLVGMINLSSSGLLLTSRIVFGAWQVLLVSGVPTIR